MVAVASPLMLRPFEFLLLDAVIEPPLISSEPAARLIAFAFTLVALTERVPSLIVTLGLPFSSSPAVTEMTEAMAVVAVAPEVSEMVGLEVSVPIVTSEEPVAEMTVVAAEPDALIVPPSMLAFALSDKLSTVVLASIVPPVMVKLPAEVMSSLVLLTWESVPLVPPLMVSVPPDWMLNALPSVVVTLTW